jgi:pilus assembly protein CpaB
VTLEVTPKIAEKIAVAQTIGTLSLSLRSLADNQTELDQAIASGTVKVPAGATKDQEEKFLNQAMNRPIDKGATFVTGGDVSRFQRRTAPSQELPRAMFQGYNPPAPAAPAPTGRSNRSSGPATYSAPPTVRVTRGKNTTEESVGGN